MEAPLPLAFSKETDPGERVQHGASQWWGVLLRRNTGADQDKKQ